MPPKLEGTAVEVVLLSYQFVVEGHGISFGLSALSFRYLLYSMFLPRTTTSPIAVSAIAA
jgi:hypothetical protein